jgi:hypothetical protein
MMDVMNYLIIYCAVDNQRRMADEGAIDCLVDLLDSPYDLIQRQSAKALANMGVNAENKHLIAQRGAIAKLLRLLQENNSSMGMNTYGSGISAHGGPLSVKIEVVAALANLAVNGE